MTGLRDSSIDGIEMYKVGRAYIDGAWKKYFWGQLLLGLGKEGRQRCKRKLG